MSEKLPTLVKYKEGPAEQKQLVMSYEGPKGGNGQGFTKCRPLSPGKRPASYACRAISNPWLARIGLAIAIIVFVVVFVALYSRMQAKVDDMEERLSALEGLIKELEDRIQCLVIDDAKHDRRGSRCGQNAAAAESHADLTTGPTPAPQPSTDSAEHNDWAADPQSRSRTTLAQKSGQAKEGRPTGVVYTAWGQKFCPSNSPLAYYGIGVVSSDTSALLCMEADDVRYVHPANISNVPRVQIRPARLDNTQGIFDDGTTNDSQLPCAVCHTFKASAVFMQPAMTACPTSNWEKPYVGFLMSTGSEFVCVRKDLKPDRTRPEKGWGGTLKLAQYPAAYDYPHGAVPCVVCLLKSSPV